MLYSAPVERALKAAHLAHAGQTRKGDPEKPYAVHPAHVALLLARVGADDTVLQAALLHDVVEDCDAWTTERVAAEFGGRVAGIVAELSEDKSKSWEERKRDGVARAPRLSAEAAAVKAADKAHNLASLREQLEAAADPDSVWARFKGGRERTLAMDRELVEALAPRVAPALGRELREQFAALEREAARERRLSPDTTG